MHRFALLLLSICFAFPTLALAAIQEASDFTFTGYIEPSYNYLLRSNHFTSGKHDRNFDLEPNGFTLQQAAVTIAKQPKQGFGALLNLVLGRDANTLSPAGINPDYFGIQNIGLTPAQAFLQYRRNAFTIQAGKYASPIGEENYNPTYDKNFSRSLLDSYAEPATMLGIKGVYIVNDRLELALDLSNGWDTIQYTSRPKTIQIYAFYKPNMRFSLEATGLSGVQPITDGASSGPTGRRNALDLVGTYQVNDKLNFAANYDYGMQSLAALPANRNAAAFWQGLAAYLNYQFTDKWYTSLRGEFFSDRSGYRTGVAQSLREVTLTLAYSVFKSLQLRAETRHDISNVKSFVTINGRGANTNQQSFALEGLYKF